MITEVAFRRIAYRRRPAFSFQQFAPMIWVKEDPTDQAQVDFLFTPIEQRFCLGLEYAMNTSRKLAVCRLTTIALAMAIPICTAQAQRHGWGGGGGWHGGGGGGWNGGGWHSGGDWGGGGWGWWPGLALGLAIPPLLYAPPPVYYYPPPAYYPGAGYYPPPPAYYQPPYPYGYQPGYYGGGTAYRAYPGYGMSMRLDPNNCGTPDEPKPCTR